MCVLFELEKFKLYLKHDLPLQLSKTLLLLKLKVNVKLKQSRRQFLFLETFVMVREEVQYF